MTTGLWITVGLLLLATLALALWQHRSQRRRVGETERLLRWAQFVSQRPAAERSAAELLGIVRRLGAENRMWPDILAAVNPNADAVLARSLNALRGPHQFVPHVALNILEDGCNRAIARNPGAGERDAIDEALRSAALIVHVGD